MALTIEEALDTQDAIYRRIAEGCPAPPAWRAASLHPDFRFGQCLNYGTGFYAINRETNEVCEHPGGMRWYRDGTILMCPTCFLDGT